jgi:hypothetical protein
LRALIGLSLQTFENEELIGALEAVPDNARLIEHQRSAVGVAGLGEAVELVFGHGWS